jgi:hypothetical protein
MLSCGVYTKGAETASEGNIAPSFGEVDRLVDEKVAMKVGNTRLVRPVFRASSELRFPFRRFFSSLISINGICQRTW